MKKIVLIGIIAVLLIVVGIIYFIYVPLTVCGIEQCHGLEITCGSDVALSCTAIYYPGDFCKQFAVCQLGISGCQLKEDTRFQECKSCLDSCVEELARDQEDPLNEGILKYAGCESQCRKEVFG